MAHSKTNYRLIGILVLYSIFYFGLKMPSIPSPCINMSPVQITSIHTDTDTARAPPQIYPDVYRPIYLNVHMAKTAGTERNVMLANQFERICGHKGYSYDAYQTARRYTDSGATNVNSGPVRDIYSVHYAPFSRHRVPFFSMNEIGYEDCDVISNEQPWTFWRDKLPLSLYAEQKVPVEFHVPCRHPIDHLMSQCNHSGLTFQCDADSLEMQIDACVIEMNRFSFQLVQHFESLEKSLGLKSSFQCFDGLAIESYVEYMQSRLQPRRFTPAYTHRPSNGRRKRELECVWQQDETFRQKLRQLLLNKFEYYQFCDRCMGSENQMML